MNPDPKITLPKQWRDWCKSMRIGRTPGRRFGKGQAQHHWFYLKGRGHHWRINMYGMLQMSCPSEQFDRWALSVRSETTMPKTKAQFQAAVRAMLAGHHRIDRER